MGGGNSGAGLLPLTGWALDDNGVLAVDILVDGLVAGRAAYGRARAGVAARFPGFPDSAHPGFGFQLDTTHYLNGLHTVAVRVKSRAGEVALLPPQPIYFNNVEARPRAVRPDRVPQAAGRAARQLRPGQPEPPLQRDLRLRPRRRHPATTTPASATSSC